MNKDIAHILNKYYLLFENPEFIVNDPISIPHKFSKKEDIEISAFFSAILAWGNRKAIISSCNMLMNLMDNAPFDFTINAQHKDVSKINRFYYRTFQPSDLTYFISSIRNIYNNHEGLENVFFKAYSSSNNDKIKNAISYFREVFFETPYPQRVTKHIANPFKGSAAKRINMFLRWMIRSNKQGVDFGLWKAFNAADLIIPLDVHVGNTSRKLNLIKTNANNWNTAHLLTQELKSLDSSDPVKYDFALFGIGNSKIIL